MTPVKHTDKAHKRNPGVMYAKALDHHAQIERELARVMNRWQKSRAALKRVEQKLDKAQAEFI